MNQYARNPRVADFAPVKLLCALLILLATMTVAAPATALARAAAPPPVVAFVGDSNAALAMPSVNSVLPPEFDPADVSRSGAGIRGLGCADPCYPNLWMNKMRELHEDETPDAYVVELGINDTPGPGRWNGIGYSYYSQKIDWLMQFFHDRPVLWTNLPCDLEPVNRQVGCAVVNRALNAAQMRHENLTVLDWSSLATDNPSWLGSYGGIHLTPDGQAAWTRFVDDALREQFDT